MAFEIGMIPKGWERGRQLMIRNPPKDGYGYVMESSREYNPDRNRDHDDIGMVTFRAEDIDRVRAWLEWWEEK